jgi:transcription initiation factor TFIIIB Brf1 subunit/transcription initiation factor TFIIB
MSSLVSQTYVPSHEFFSFLDEDENNHQTDELKIKSKKEISNLYYQITEDIEEDDEEDQQNVEDDEIESIESAFGIRTVKEDVCIRCGESDGLYNNNEMIVCRFCGCENSMIIDSNPEWRFYGSDDNRHSSDPNRCGLPVSPYIKDASLSIVILGRGYESFRKLNCWNGLTYRERTLMTILNMIMNKANIENVPQSVVDQTIHLYQTVCLNSVKRGTSRESLIAACFSYALRENGFMRSDHEIADLFGLKIKKFTKGYNLFLDLMHKNDKDFVKRMKPTDSKEIIRNYCDYLEFTEVQKRSCMIALYAIQKMGICPENNPESISIGIIYLISEHYQLPYTKRQIAEICKTSEVTVSSTYSQMIRYVRYLIPGRT